MRDDRRLVRLAWGRTLAVATIAVVVQVTVLDQLGFGGLARVDLPLLLLVAVASSARSDDAAVVGFAAGLATDLYHLGPFGLHGLVYCVIAFTVAVATARLDHSVRLPLARRAQAPRALVVARRAVIAGVATVGSGAALVAVASAAAPALPDPAQLAPAMAVRAVVGSVVAIQVVHPAVVRLGLVGTVGTTGHRWARHRIPPTERRWTGGPSPIRRL